ncbi:MAG: hypothetical protein RL318_437 [Fibrobacterota bacterium]|jgi:hypothetical protein
MLGKLLRIVRCWKGGHRWDDWRKPVPGSCLERRRCGCCRREEERERHDLGPWDYPAEDLCDCFRACTRCGLRERQVRHAYGTFQIEGKDGCAKTATCSRCGQRKTRTVHKWDVSGSGERTCLRCGASGGERNERDGDSSDED